MSKLTIKVKRAYDDPARSDGSRVLVDRIWPRGVSKDDAALDAWNKEVSPSTKLRKWFDHDPAKWSEFKKKYFAELAEQHEGVEAVLDACKGKTLTLVFAAKDAEHNNAVALKEYIERHAKSLHVA